MVLFCYIYIYIYNITPWSGQCNFCSCAIGIAGSRFTPCITTTSDETQNVRAPYGLKLLALDRQAIRLLYRAFCQLPVQFCAEHYFKLLLLLSKHDGGVHFTVADTPFAGSTQHYSLVDGKPQAACVPAPITQHCLLPDGEWC